MALSIAYTSQAGTAYNLTFREFTGQEIGRTYLSQAEYSRAVSGSQILSGPPTRTKYLWTVSAPLQKADALVLDSMFRAWDEDRGTGISAAVGVLDQNFGPDVSGSAVFSTPPIFTYVSKTFIICDFGLTEV